MANKHVVNPCDNSGKSEGIGPDAVPTVGVWKAECPVCGNKATVNKKSLVFRKHSKDSK